MTDAPDTPTAQLAADVEAILRIGGADLLMHADPQRPDPPPPMPEFARETAATYLDKVTGCPHANRPSRECFHTKPDGPLLASVIARYAWLRDADQLPPATEDAVVAWRTEVEVCGIVLDGMLRTVRA